jgi:ligand-binding SRPBCC domain-containing protein
VNHARGARDPDGDDASYLVDDVTYTLPLGRLGALVAGRAVARRLERMFAYRHEVTRAACEEGEARETR